MKIFLAEIFAAGLIIAALGALSSSLAESPGTQKPALSKSPAVSQSVSGGAALPGAPGKKKNTGGFGDLPMTPAGSDREDCFNDEIPYTPIPQG